MAKIKSKYLYSRNSFYHIYNRGNNKKLIFFENKDYQRFVNNLLQYEIDYELSIYAYCLMPNHYHLLIRLGQKRSDISKYMHRCMTAYVMYFNKKYKSVGRLFQSPFQVKKLCNIKSIIRVVLYIENNPIEAKLVKASSNYKWLEILPKHRKRNSKIVNK